MISNLNNIPDKGISDKMLIREMSRLSNDISNRDTNNELFALIKDHKWDQFINLLKSSELGIDVNIRDEQNNYLLTYAILYNQSKIVKILVDKGANIDITIENEEMSILYLAIKYAYYDILKILLEHNKITIGISVLNIRDKNYNVPIHYAIKFNNLDATKLLLEYGANLNVTDKNQYNSLHLAVYGRSYELCKLILDHNIDINHRCNTGETALHIACNLELYEIVNLLIEKKKGVININIQDFGHEFTALHYSINLNNKKITKILIENSADINLQDVFGNTALHYCMVESNLETANTLLSAPHINLNLWNIDGNLPLHIILESMGSNGNNSIEYIANYMELMLDKTNLNIQNNDGNTCLHFICRYKLWEYYKIILVKKKLDIFVMNRNKKRPFDFVSPEDKNVFLDLISESYLFRLRQSDIEWNNEWENICKKKLILDEVSFEKSELSKELKKLGISKNNIGKKNDICKTIVYEKLKQMAESKDPITCQQSYPVRKNYMCLNINSVMGGKELSMCTFTGTTLDILMGLIYILKKHTMTCSTISKNFSENKDLCKFYKSLGIIMNAQCEFLNFEIVWVFQKLYLTEDFFENFTKCNENKNIRFIVVPLGIEMREGSHANYLLYDKNTKEIERFEPHGSTTPPGFNYNPNLLDDILENKFYEFNEELKYIRPKDYLPKVGFQLLDVYETKKKRIGDPSGFCALWALWYVDMRISHKNISRNDLVIGMIKNIKSQNLSFKNLIRNYASNIIEIRDNILSKGNIDINDWLNDQYSEKQLNAILDEIRIEIQNIMNC
jgi:ankyrin repeat protein